MHFIQKEFHSHILQSNQNMDTDNKYMEENWLPDFFLLSLSALISSGFIQELSFV
jgi:hypothetical protein